MKLLVLFAALFISQMSFAEEIYAPKYFCHDAGGFLTDDDFVRLTLGYELQKKRDNYRSDPSLPEGYEIGSVDEFLKQHPDCCSVERGSSYMRRGWLERWIDGEQVAVWIVIPSTTVGERMLNLTYFTNQCGEMNEDRSFGFSVRRTE